MKEQLITFETAKLAKEKELCRYFNKGTDYVKAFYSEDGINYKETEFQQEDCIIEDRYFRPTQSLLQKWLREVHNIKLWVEFNYTREWFSYYLDKYDNKKIILRKDVRNQSFEEALEQGLQEALKLI